MRIHIRHIALFSMIVWSVIAKAQTVIDGSGNLTNYAKYSDSIPGTYATAYRLRVKTDSLAAALAATIQASLDLKANLASPAFTGTLTSTGSIGYATGAGGTVTQATNKTTAVTLNKISGRITMNGAALAAGAEAAFTLNNSTIAATDVIIVNVQSVGTAGAYLVSVGAVAAGSCSITVSNASAGSLSQAIVLNFCVIKSSIN